MDTNSRTCPDGRLRTPPHRLAGPAAAWLRGAAAMLTASLGRAARVRRDMRLLSEMDDRALRDIGLHRAEIEHAACRVCR